MSHWTWDRSNFLQCTTGTLSDLPGAKMLSLKFQDSSFLPISTRHRSLIAVIGSMVVVNLVYGLTLPLLSLILDAQGISKSLIGLSILVQASAGVVLAPFMPAIILRVGAAPVMRYATLTAAGAIIALGLLQDIYVWLPIRFLLGAAAAILCNSPRQCRR